MFCCCSKLRSAMLAGAAVIVLSGWVATHDQPDTSTQPDTSAQPEAQPDMQAMMAMMHKASLPDEHHKALEPMIGQWNAEMVFMGGPTEMKATGDAENTWELGGRVMRSTFHTDDFMGMSFDGIGYTGYDKIKGHYWTTWMDSFSTGVFMETGTMSDDGQTLTVTGTGETPMGDVDMKHVTRIISDDKHVVEFWEPNPMTGEMAKTGAITYTRKQQ